MPVQKLLSDDAVVGLDPAVPRKALCITDLHFVTARPLHVSATDELPSAIRSDHARKPSIRTKSLQKFKQVLHSRLFGTDAQDALATVVVDDIEDGESLATG